MKIVIATGIFPPDIGGPATYSETLARELTKRNFEVAVVCYGDQKFPISNFQFPNKSQFLISKNYKVLKVSRKIPKGVRHLIYFWRVLRAAKGADIIYAQDLISAGLPALAAAKLLRKKFALKIVGDYAWESYAQRSAASLEFPISNFQFPNIDEFQSKRYDFKTEVLRFLERLVARKADVIITPSEYLKKLVIDWGINENKIKVIYNAYTGTSSVIASEAALIAAKRGNLIGIASDEALAMTASGFPAMTKGDIIISVGRLVPWKGFGALIEIMPDLLKENPNFKLLIVGEGPDEKDLRFRIEDLRLKDSVILTGKLPHSELTAYLRTAKMFVLNTAYEGLSHQLLEALAAGVPVITTNVCGNPEVITDGENGILVGFDDKTALKEAILRVWKDRALAEKFIQNGKKTLEKFTLERMIEETTRQLTVNSKQ